MNKKLKTNIRHQIAKLLKNERLIHNDTIEQLAINSKINNTAIIIKIESGHSSVSWKYIKRIADYYHKEIKFRLIDRQ